MKLQTFGSVMLAAALSFGLASTARAQAVSESLLASVKAATSENVGESASAIAQLRSQGESGVQAFFTAYKQELQSREVTPERQRLSAALDAICQQKDCHASRLYWHTDLEQAKAASLATGKPILSLRLLGKLDEELSCANSRFFRVALYPNAEVAQLLSDRFILHWQSVRPVPKVTIDFGDGRQIERTLTGNSIHYVLNAQGKIIDALPGMYSPQAFAQQLQQAAKVVKDAAKLPEVQQDNFIRKYHRDRLEAIQTQWQADLKKLGIDPPAGLAPIPAQVPTAREAGARAVAKMMVEMPLVSVVSGNQQALTQITDAAAWEKIAQLHPATLDGNSLSLMRRKNPQAFEIAGKGIVPGSAEDPLAPVAKRFESLMAMDAVRNQYLLQPQIYSWLIEWPFNDVDSINEAVYSQLFLTPSSDPWLGLLPGDGYTAIQNDGVKQ